MKWGLIHRAGEFPLRYSHPFVLFVAFVVKQICVNR